MRNRLRSWTRLLDVQGQRVRLAEGRLAELLRQQRELEQQQRELLESFSADERFAGLFIDLRARRFQALSKALQVMKPVVAAAEATVLDHAKRSCGSSQGSRWSSETIAPMSSGGN